MNSSLRMLMSSLVLGLITSANVFAADMFIKVSDSKGVARVINCPSGVCAMNDLAADTYQVQVCDEKGKPTVSSVSLAHSVVSPRDAASGLATGKRSHKPLSLRKSLDKSSPPLFTFVVSEPGSQVTIHSSEQAVMPATKSAVQ